MLVNISASDTWYGRAIRWATKSKFNHSFFTYRSDFWNRFYTTDIDERGVRLLPAAKVYRQFIRLESYECDIDLKEGLRKCQSDIGEGYDWGGVFGIFLSLFFKAFKNRNAFENSSRMFCSEFVAKVLRSAKVPGSEKLEPDLVTPEDVRRFIIDSPHFTQVENPLPIGKNDD